MKKVLTDLSIRLGYFAIGTVGFTTLIPNGMMSDSGTKTVELASSIGIASSCILMVAGAIGVLNYNPYLSLRYAKTGVVTGCVLQGTALCIFGCRPKGW